MKKLISALFFSIVVLSAQAHTIEFSQCDNGSFSIKGSLFDYHGTNKDSVVVYSTSNGLIGGTVTWKGYAFVGSNGKFTLTHVPFTPSAGTTFYYTQYSKNANGTWSKTWPTNTTASSQLIKSTGCIVTPITGMETFDEKLDASGNLIFTWTSYTELNNSGFDIEYSEDAINFKSIKHVASQADGGNSGMPINYKVSIYPEVVTVLAGIGGGFGLIFILMIAGPLVFSAKYRKQWFSGVAPIVIALTMLMSTSLISCSKSNDTVVKVTHGKKYFRLKQTDLDGHASYSPTLIRTV